MTTSARSDMPPAPQRRRQHRHCHQQRDRKSTRLNSSHLVISYAVFCLKKKKFLHSGLVRFPNRQSFVLLSGALTPVPQPLVGPHSASRPRASSLSFDAHSASSVRAIL